MQEHNNNINNVNMESISVFRFPGCSDEANTNIRGSQSNKPGKWVFQHPKQLPLFPLSKAAVVIMFPSHIIASRICDSLRLRSIHAEYNESQAICTTSSYIRYSVDLYDDGDGNTMVEIIKISGNGFAFRKEREMVMNAARGKGGITPSNLPNSKMLKLPPAKTPITQLPPPPTTTTERNFEENLVRRAGDQLHLHSNNSDLQLSVLENFSAMTSPSKINQESAQSLSRAILSNDLNFQSTIVSILASQLQKQQQETNDEKTNRDKSRKQLMINACLSIVNNALSLLSDLNFLENILIENNNESDDEEFIAAMIGHCTSIISECSCPHNTCLALKCLYIFYTNSTIAQDILLTEDSSSSSRRSYIRNAEKFGKQCHMNLQIEAHRLLTALQS